MQITAHKLRILIPPKDDLKKAIRASRLALCDGDLVAISSKVVAIGEGRTVPIGSIAKVELVVREADWYRRTLRSKYGGRRLFTIAGGAMVGAAGIDESNGAGHYILYPQDPQKSAWLLRQWLSRTYRVKNIGVIITDSTSVPLRRGAVGFALGYSGFAPLRDYRGQRDLFDRTFQYEVANIADSLATAANVVMGEGREQTPLAVIRDAPGITFVSREKKSDTLGVDPVDDLFAPLFFSSKWKKGK